MWPWVSVRRQLTLINMDVKNDCGDVNCPRHGSLKLRGRSFEGEIVSARMRKTASFSLERREYDRKYQRFEKRYTSLKVHNPDCISAREGDKVRVMECRPLSKTKKFVIVEKVLNATG